MSRLGHLLPFVLSGAVAVASGCKSPSVTALTANPSNNPSVANSIVSTSNTNGFAIDNGDIVLVSSVSDHSDVTKMSADATTDDATEEFDVSGASDNESSPSKSGDDEPDENSTKTQDDNKTAKNSSALPAPIIVEPILTTASGPVAPLSIAEAVQTALSSNKSILVLGYSPQEASTLWASECAAFDPVVGIAARGANFDRQLSSFIDSGGVIPTNIQQTDLFGPTRLNNLSISKLLETGGTVEVGLGTNYLHQDLVGGLVFLNPSWRSALNFQFNQPLGRGRGRAVTTAPLRIAQSNSNQVAHQFQASVNAVVRDVQLAYWTWKLAALQYEVRTGAVAQAEKTVTIEQERLELDEGTLPDVRQAQDQLQRFRIEALLAKNNLAQAKVSLARLLGKSSYEMFYDAAADEPETDNQFVREIGEASALSRPELMAVQSNIRSAQIELSAAAANLRPDLDMQFNYAITGLESQLDDSLSTVFDNRFNEWILGLDYKRAVGLRAAHANLRRARIRLARAQADRENIQLEIMNDVALAWNDLQTRLEALQIQRERVEIAEQLLKSRDELYDEGEASLDLKVRSQSIVIDAKIAALESQISAQQAIVQWEYATGQQYYVEFADN